jgi:hypothetical protein
MQKPFDLPSYAVLAKNRTSPSERAGDKESGSKGAESGEIWDTRASPHDITNEASLTQRSFPPWAWSYD